MCTFQVCPINMKRRHYKETDLKLKTIGSVGTGNDDFANPLCGTTHSAYVSSIPPSTSCYIPIVNLTILPTD